MDSGSDSSSKFPMALECVFLKKVKNVSMGFLSMSFFSMFFLLM